MGYAIENITSLPFGQLIGGPLVAGIDAQAQAAKATVDFILQVGFEPGATNANPPVPIQDPFAEDDNGKEIMQPKVGEIRTVTFLYTALNENGENDKRTLTVPLLSIIPVPFFAIDEMTIDFMAKISEVITSNNRTERESTKAASANASAGWGPFKASMKGSLSSKHSSSSSSDSKFQTELTMNIHVRASQNDMPAGLSKVLEILANKVTEKSVPAPVVQ